MMSTKSDSIAGAVSALAALAAAELAAGLARLPSLVEAVAGFVIDIVPGPVKEVAISIFGTKDKVALVVGIAVVSVLLGAVLGRIGRRHYLVAVDAFAVFGLLGAVAAWRQGAFKALLAGAFATVVGSLVLGWLLMRQRTGLQESASVNETAGPSVDVGRRAFFRTAGSVAALGLLAAGAGRFLLEKAKVAVSRRQDVVLPAVLERVPVMVPANSIDVPGISPIVVPNEEFYRIDTALTVPQIDLDEWRLKVTGMVKRPYELRYEELLELASVERYVTLSCVSNEVGGSLVGNALWQGVRLSDILDRAGVNDGAEQIVGRSAANNGFTVGFPVEVAFDGREALVAVGMNGEPLPFDHGFPARLVVAGLYGYVSATKWISEIELTTWDGFDAYWIPRGWAKEAPVKTQSRIDTPPSFGSIAPGPRQVAGVAWAPHRGISRVELKVNDDAWQEARVSQPLSNDAWVQWTFGWEATVGDHVIQVRATDGTGETQTEEVRRVLPDGATGYHKIAVKVLS